jgi:hypothetical protein
MISLKDFMEVVGYRISEGSPYLWGCFGNNAFSIDSVREIDGRIESTVTVTFSTADQTVYLVEAFDYVNNRAYRISNPIYKDLYFEECARRYVDDVAWEDVKFIDLETDEDWIEKATAIAEGLSYDTRVQIPIEFTDEELLTYMKLAHSRDITFNQLVEESLSEAIRQYKGTSK